MKLYNISPSGHNYCHVKGFIVYKWTEGELRVACKYISYIVHLTEKPIRKRFRGDSVIRSAKDMLYIRHSSVETSC